MSTLRIRMMKLETTIPLVLALPSSKAPPSTIHKMVRSDASGNPNGQISAQQGEKDAEDDQDGVDHHRGQHLRKHQVGGGVYAHDLQSVNLFRHTHTANLRGNPGAQVADQQQTDDGGTKLHHNGGTGNKADRPGWDPAAFNLHGRLGGDDATHCDGHNADNQHGANPHRLHLKDKLLEEDLGLVGFRKDFLQKDEVFADNGKGIFKHRLNQGRKDTLSFNTAMNFV